MSAVLEQVSLELKAYNENNYYPVTGYNDSKLQPLFDSFKNAKQPLNALSGGLQSFFSGQGRFFISKVQLKEGISLPYSGVIALAATKALDKQTVRALAGCGVRLHLKLGEDRLSWERYIYGFIKDIHFCGATQSAESDTGGRTYLYELNLHSPLEKLRHRHNAFKFSTLDITAVIEKLLEPLKTDVEIIKESSFSDFTKNKKIMAGRANVDYQQGRENDLEFLQRLLLLYGFNYVFVHLKSKGKVCLYLSHNTEKMFSAYPLDECVDQTPVSADAQLVKCNLYGQEKGKDKSNDSIDNLYRLKSLDFLTSYHEQDEYDEYVSRELCSDGYYPAARNDLGVAANHNRLFAKNNLSTALSQRSNTYYCECSQLVFLPGRIAEVADAYGVDGQEKLLITKSLLEVVNPTPVEKLITLKQNTYNLKVGFDAVESTDNAGVDSKQVGSYAAVRSQDIVRDAGVSDICRHLYHEQQVMQGELDENFKQQVFFTATVCDGQGRVGREDDDPNLGSPDKGVVCIEPSDNTAAPVRFYALLEDSKKPVVVEYTSNQRLDPRALNLPAIGDRVMICKSNGSFYFHSFLAPKYSSAFFSPQRRVSAVGAKNGGSTGLSHVKLMVWDDNEKIRNNVTHKYITENIVATSGWLTTSTSSKDAAIMEAIKNQGINAIVLGYKDQGVIANFYASPINSSQMSSKIDANPNLTDDEKTAAKKSWSECCTTLAKAYGSAKSDVTNKEREILRKQQALAEAVYHKTEETAGLSSQLELLNQEYKQSSEKLTKLDQSIIDCVNELKKDVLFTLDEFKLTSSELYSEGDLNITAKGTLRIQASSISLVSTDGDLSLLAKGTNNVTVNSELGTAKLSSRNCGIDINPYRIMQVATAYPHGTPFFGSTLTLDQFQGVKITGSDFSANGWLGATIGDAFLGQVSVSNGGVSVNGAEVTMTVNKTAPLVTNLAMLTLGMAKDTVMVTTDQASDKIDWKDLTEDERARTKDNVKSMSNLSINMIMGDLGKVAQNIVGGKYGKDSDVYKVKSDWNKKVKTYHVDPNHRDRAVENARKPSIFERVVLILRALLFVADQMVMILDLMSAVSNIIKENQRKKFNQGTDKIVKNYKSFDEYLENEYTVVNFLTEPEKYAMTFLEEVKTWVTVTKIITAYTNQLAIITAKVAENTTTYSKMSMKGTYTQFEGVYFDVATDSYQLGNTAMAGQDVGQVADVFDVAQDDGATDND